VPQELESPHTPDDLYLARGNDVCDARPVLTGDVFDDVEVTEPDGSRACLSIMIVEHPCSLRSDGVNLVPKLLVAAVRPREVIGSWRGNFSLMFLPNGGRPTRSRLLKGSARPGSTTKVSSSSHGTSGSATRSPSPGSARSSWTVLPIPMTSRTRPG
jgi:hypothetical protein